MQKKMCISLLYCGLEDLFNRKEKEVIAKRAKLHIEYILSVSLRKS